MGTEVDPRRFLFVMWEAGGNIPPQLGLARKLVERGHEVRVLTEPSVEQEVLDTGASFASFQKAPHRRDRTAATDFVRDFDAKTPLGAFAAIRDHVLFGPARAYAEDTLEEIKRFRPHVLAPDWMLTGAAVAGEATQVPTALLVHNMNLVPEPNKPAPGFGFLPAKTHLGRIRDRVFASMFLRLFNKGLPALNDARRALGLNPLPHVLNHLARAERFLVLYPEAFDFPGGQHPSHLRHVGAILDQPGWTDPWISPWEPDDSRPLVVISMSTTFMAQELALRRCIAAAASMPVRALVTVGPALDPGVFTASENVVVVRSAPHDQVFAHASAIVTHAGLGTVLRALAHGVPLVCLPMGRDQDDVAARVRWHGAGLKVRPGGSSAKIRAALTAVLHDRSFRDEAQRLAAAIEADNKDDRAITELQELASRGALTPLKSNSAPW
jgi:MGT family glycosyltransferase